MTQKRKFYKNKTKKNIKKNKRQKHIKIKTQKRKKIRRGTRRYKLYGGEDIDEESRIAFTKLQKEKTIFRRELSNNLNSIVNNLKNNNCSKVGTAITNITKLFTEEKYRHLINTLIPISAEGKYVDKPFSYNPGNPPLPPIVNFISPINILFNFESLKRKLSKVKQVPPNMLPIEYLLVSYYNGGGDFNLLTSNKIDDNGVSRNMTPLQYEIYKKRWDNVDILLNPEQPFYTVVTNPSYYDENTKAKIEMHKQEMKKIPVLQQLERTQQQKQQQKQQQRQVLQQLQEREQQRQQQRQQQRRQQLQQKRTSPMNVLPPAQQKTRRILPVLDTIETTPAIEGSLPRQQMKRIPAKYPRLKLPYTFPKQHYYNSNSEPTFWLTIFSKGELFSLKDMFQNLYIENMSSSKEIKEWSVCKILEKIFPSYLSINFLTNVIDNNNVNLLNCFITLMYGIILYKLYTTNQEYLFIFKGGRAIQIALQDIHEKYFSVDTDILIIPNKNVNATYNLVKMNSLSGHIGFLIKWMIPEELDISIHMPRSKYNENPDITKIVYNNEFLSRPLHIALSDIGINKLIGEAETFFSEFVEIPLLIRDLQPYQHVLFIIPTIDNMLHEKLYYYSKYYSKYLELNKEIGEKKMALQESKSILEQKVKDLNTQIIDKNREKGDLNSRLKRNPSEAKNIQQNISNINKSISELTKQKNDESLKIEEMNKQIEQIQNNKELNEASFYIEKFRKSIDILLRNILTRDHREINPDSKKDVVESYFSRENFSEFNEKETIINSLIGN